MNPSVEETTQAGHSSVRPHLRVHLVQVFVSDQELSLRFYLDRLGFTLAFDAHLPEGGRWVAVSPPDGSCILALVKPKDDELNGRIGGPTGVVFVTDDVPAKYEEWVSRGVRFRHPPVAPSWGGVFAVFEDIDGNLFSLVGFDAIAEAIEAERRAVAEREERERRAAHEMAIAKQVQARLFPQRLPEVPTLNYSGLCIQARQVGGDYYDFLDLGPGKLGLVVGDVAGKGIAAALLMANLQGNLRSQHGVALDDLRGLLQSVNQLFYDNTPDASYATLFFGQYLSGVRRLRYVNSGHLPPLLIRGRGGVERLEPTATVLGIFRDWESDVAEVGLEPGDTLVIYTDGITEATNAIGEEFGQSRLSAVLCEHADLQPADLVRTVIDAIGEFAGEDQQDDLTLVVARCRS
jgi:serine phosphatase RsbU (regulator of sigma subunit)/catechol 2,3-dioxygenase-like lactoylglutathione lyase family enzyme